MRKIKVVLIHEPCGGVGKYIFDLAMGLDSNKFDITLVHGTSRIDGSYRDKLAIMAKKENIRIVPCPTLVRSINISKDKRALQEIRAIIHEVKPDIIHAHSSKAGAIGRVAALLEGIPAVYSPHGWVMQNADFSKLKKCVFAVIESVLSHVATKRIINVSESEKACALRWHIDTNRKFIVIHSGVSQSKALSRAEARKRLGLSQNTTVVGSLTRFVIQKAPIQMLEVFAQFQKQHSDAYLVIFGDGPLRSEIEAFIQTHHLESNVRCMGYDADARNFVRAFDVLMMTSTAEGLPYTLLECAAAGVPMVGTEVDGIKDVILPEVNGQTYPYGDVTAGATALATVISDKEKYSSEAVYNDYRRRFRYETMIDRIEQLYMQLIGSKGRE